ncbi:MAG: tetratricopeptide (TPR) repeat protein [Bacillariaceae sp.]|jgi:tetratricopeptide (TPR) repeat protein
MEIRDLVVPADTSEISSMAISKTSQPPQLGNAPENLNEKPDSRDSRDSPATVIEVHGYSTRTTIPTTDVGVITPAPPTVFTSRRDNKEEKHASRLRRHQKERKNYENSLPPIQECPEEEEEGEDDSIHGKCLGFVCLPVDDDISLYIRPLSTPTGSNNNFIVEVQLLIDAASQRASQGNEEKAVAIYKDGLRILRQGIQRILEQMEIAASSKPKFEKTALFIILHEEWTEVALVIADIRKRMALIYERQEEYDKAISCCEEARTIYERQAIFDKRHHKKGSSAREEGSSMEDMVEKIEEAMESQYIRKSLHQTVERIREKIAATTDETSRGFLYEDIFDKLSTVLSLELMYLGETHPQIAYTKSLLSVFYSEIKQSEKALRAMNDAILICEIALGDSHPRTAIMYQEAAKLYEHIDSKDNVVKAIDFYEKAIVTLERGEGNISEKKCSILNDLGVLYIQQKQYNVAVKKLSDAIHIYEEGFVEGFVEGSDYTSTKHIQMWVNLAECYGLQEEHELATNAARNALRIQRDKRKLYDVSAKDLGQIPGLISNSSIALTLKKLGKSLAAESKFDLACGSFLEALSILRADFSIAQELVKFNPTVDLQKRQDEIACVLYHIAKVKLTDKKYTEAAKLYGESLQLRKASDKQRKPEKRSNYVHCAMCLAGIGSIELLRNREGDAFKSFNQALFYIRKEGFPDSHPIVNMIWKKSHLAASRMHKERYPVAVTDIGCIGGYEATISRLEEKAEISRKTRDYKACIKTIDVIVDMKRTVLAKLEEEKQNTKNAKHQLVASLITMGEIVLITNSTKKSIACINEATDLLKTSDRDDQRDKYFEEIDKIVHKVKKMKQRSETMAEF